MTAMSLGSFRRGFAVATAMWAVLIATSFGNLYIAPFLDVFLVSTIPFAIAMYVLQNDRRALRGLIVGWITVGAAAFLAIVTLLVAGIGS